MKAYRKVVLNLQGKVIEEDSYEYTGSIAQCGSGGGSSGKSDWPDYMKTIHTTWLGEMDALVPVTNPYTGMVAPTLSLTEINSYLANYKAYSTSIGNSLTAFKSLWSGWLSLQTSGITAALTAELDTHGVPEFESGMSDINAVQTSSFALGKSMLYARVGLEAAKLALLNTNQAVQLTIQYGEALRAQFLAEMEWFKGTVIAVAENMARQDELDIEEAKWIFFNYREAGALLGAIGGSAAMQGSHKPNPLASALGGAMTGAAAGAAFGGVGAVAGAVIGGVGGYLSAS